MGWGLISRASPRRRGASTPTRSGRGLRTATPAGAEQAGASGHWLKDDHAGELAYKPREVSRRSDTRVAVPAARSAIVVGMSYGGREPSGTVARYARGDDYHDVMIERLRG